MKDMNKTAAISLGALGVAALVTGGILAVRNSKEYRAMRAVRRTNAVLRRMGNFLSRMADAADECI